MGKSSAAEGFAVRIGIGLFILVVGLTIWSYFRLGLGLP